MRMLVIPQLAVIAGLTMSMTVTVGGPVFVSVLVIVPAVMEAMAGCISRVAVTGIRAAAVAVRGGTAGIREPRPALTVRVTGHQAPLGGIHGT